MPKIKVGDIFTLQTTRGFVYLHYVYENKAISELIRVLPGFYETKIDDVDILAKQNELFMIYFPLAVAFRKKIVHHSGFSEYINFIKPKYMRTTHKIGGENLGWHIVDTETLKREFVKELTSEQRKLNPWGIWNDTLLTENLLSGWNLENWN